MMNGASGQASVGVVALTTTCRIHWANSTAMRMLKEYWNGACRNNLLPSAVAQWLHGQDVPQEHVAELSFSEPQLVVDKDGRRLVVRHQHDSTACLLLLFEEEEREVAGVVPDALASHGLTMREAEVLGWVAQGKTNKDVGAILSLSPRTVQKHLERVYEKLGVETRTAAAACAMEARRGHWAMK